jgi:hypothetical protein
VGGSDSLFIHFRYPTNKQNAIWLKRRQNIAPSQIATQLKVSRPFVSQAQKIAERRIKKLLINAAEVNRIKIQNLSTEYGFAVGFCPTHQSKTYITYSPEYRVQVWFDHEGDCDTCEESDHCTKILRGLAIEWEIGLPNNVPPTKIAKTLFTKIMERIGWSGRE